MPTPLLSLRGVSKRFGGLDALGDVDADFHAGEVHAVLGENGAGKSTLMNAIFGLVPIDRGTILLDGRPVRFSGPLEAGSAASAGSADLALVDALSSPRTSPGAESRRRGAARESVAAAPSGSPERSASISAI